MKDDEEQAMLSTSGVTSSEDAEEIAHFGLECRRVLSLAIPVTTSEVLAFTAYIISTAQIGRMGSVELSAITLARSIFHITGLSL
jgi:Na+-driven multidrug efflux pump